MKQTILIIKYDTTFGTHVAKVVVAVIDLKQNYSHKFLIYKDITDSHTRAIRNNLIQISDNTIAYDPTDHILNRIATSPNVNH